MIVEVEMLKGPRKGARKFIADSRARNLAKLGFVKIIKSAGDYVAELNALLLKNEADRAASQADIAEVEPLADDAPADAVSDDPAPEVIADEPIVVEPIAAEATPAPRRRGRPRKNPEA